MNTSGDIEEEEDGDEGFVHGRLPSCKIKEDWKLKKVEQITIQQGRRRSESSSCLAMIRHTTFTMQDTSFGFVFFFPHLLQIYLYLS